MSITSFRPLSHRSRIIFWTLLSSLALHLWLLFAPQIDLALPSSSANSKAIDTDLVTILKVRLTEDSSAPPSLSTPQPQKEVGTPGLPSAPVAPTTVAEAVSSSVVPVPEKAGAATGEAASEAMAEAGGASKPAPPPESEPAPYKEPQPPLRVIVEFALHKGADGMKVGKVVHTWQISDGRYVISSAMEATGVFALLKRGMFVQSSQGRITASGLEPESYWEQRGQEADRTFNAQFDYSNNILTYGSLSETATVALPPGTQDQLSFAYQFALRAPFSGTVQFFMTNGRKLGDYSYQVAGEETINTELGALRTLHISKVRQPSDDSVDIWLAADHHYLPVKVRLTNNDGDVAEQVVEGIRGE